VFEYECRNLSVLVYIFVCVCVCVQKVSDANAAKGIYTFRFNKSGKFRFVHIDDRIPCNSSGNVHYSKNANPNEIWVMLIEKAYAKLHANYESLVSGVIADGIVDLTKLLSSSAAFTGVTAGEGVCVCAVVAVDGVGSDIVVCMFVRMRCVSSICKYFNSINNSESSKI